MGVLVIAKPIITAAARMALNAAAAEAGKQAVQILAERVKNGKNGKDGQPPVRAVCVTRNRARKPMQQQRQRF